MLTTPGGKIGARYSPINNVDNGVYGDGLTTIVLPNTSACEIFIKAICTG